MGDLTRGYTFVAAEIVTPAKLHQLVESAELKANSVGTTEIADGAVTAAKLNASIAVTASQVTLASGKVLVGNGSNVGAEVLVDTGTINTSGTFGVKSGGIAVTQLATDAVETAKIKDANVTLPKLATQAANTIVANATGSPASPTAVPLGTGLEFNGGAMRVTTAISGGTVSKATTGTASIPAQGAIATWAHGLSGIPEHVSVYLECVTDHLGYRANTGSGNPDRVKLESLTSNGFRPVFTINVNDTNVEVIRFNGSSEFYLRQRVSGGNGIGSETDISADLTKWRLRFTAWK